jgi:acyl-CoA thioester hydrolase
MMGVVHHANYVTYFERGRLEYLRRRGMPYKDFVVRGYHMPVVDLSLHYKKPAHFDDLLSVETRLGAVSRVTVRFDYEVRRPLLDAPDRSELLVQGQIRLACVDAKTRPRPLPDDVMQLLFLPESPEEVVTLGSRADRAGSA